MASKEFNTYKTFLTQIDSCLQRFFEQQKPYVFCKEGCAFCCEQGQFPMSRLEFDYLCSAVDFTDNSVVNAIRKIKDDYSKTSQPTFRHRCPFLKENKCIAYEQRPLICRTFGLIQTHDNKGREEHMIPGCVDEGLNYSNVYNSKKSAFEPNKIKALKPKFEPLSYNISLGYLHNCEYSDGINFGETKPLIEWLISMYN